MWNGVWEESWTKKKTENAGPDKVDVAEIKSSDGGGAAKKDSAVKKQNRGKAKGPQKQDASKKADAASFRSINHKQSVGCNNWKKFVKVEGLKNKGGAGKSQVEKGSVPGKKVPSSKPAIHSNFNWMKHKSGKTGSRLTKNVAMDCEMVGIGEKGSVSIIARVSIVNSYGECVYDKYVKPTDTVTDYRTFVSGIRPHDIENGEEFKVVQAEVANILKGRTLIGHSLKYDLDVLMLCHPRKYIRDTFTFKKFRKSKGAMSLKALSERFISIKIQDGEHSSVEDARAAMQLYMTFRKEWEKERREASQKPKKPAKTAEPPAVLPSETTKSPFSEIANDV